MGFYNRPALARGQEAYWTTRADNSSNGHHGQPVPSTPFISTHPYHGTAPTLPPVRSLLLHGAHARGRQVHSTHGSWKKISNRIAKCDCCENRCSGVGQQCTDCGANVCHACAVSGRWLGMGNHHMNLSALDWSLAPSKKSRPVQTGSYAKGATSATATSAGRGKRARPNATHTGARPSKRKASGPAATSSQEGPLNQTAKRSKISDKVTEYNADAGAADHHWPAELGRFPDWLLDPTPSTTSSGSVTVAAAADSPRLAAATTLQRMKSMHDPPPGNIATGDKGKKEVEGYNIDPMLSAGSQDTSMLRTGCSAWRWEI
ncbi:hypothetical protein QBC33DRAFT_568754 [Phialemonium atrogriseum]|uniref:Uncharacterized protein n=1 Tax=Phialemonium atrogriseum TaxID=1093897 RepID=A0AAJ0FI46_9PEZI|nr:uncharacterized protein QBC33DRAFT_568754 [Phialemonium atrogriseum]KAK1768402.1 hypothetical protein QBC33DRAFT_568754 [Phialemonium atrogriseum]